MSTTRARRLWLIAAESARSCCSMQPHRDTGRGPSTIPDAGGSTSRPGKDEPVPDNSFELMQVGEIWRFPVKSVGGERLRARRRRRTRHRVRSGVGHLRPVHRPGADGAPRTLAAVAVGHVVDGRPSIRTEDGRRRVDRTTTCPSGSDDPSRCARRPTGRPRSRTRWTSTTRPTGCTGRALASRSTTDGRPSRSCRTTRSATGTHGGSAPI